MEIEEAARRLEALGNATRLRIYRTLVRAGEPGLAVGALQVQLEIAPSTLSHHVRALLAVGLISQERRATTLICRARYDVMDRLVAFLVAECCVDAPAKPLQPKPKAAS